MRKVQWLIEAIKDQLTAVENVNEEKQMEVLRNVKDRIEMVLRCH